MAKKRKAARQPTGPTGPKEYDAADARLGPITTHADVADEQEEYFLDKDKIMFDDEPGTKRQRRIEQEDEFLELSDDEVLAADSDDSDDSEAERRAASKKAKGNTKKGRSATSDDGSDGEDAAGDEDGDQGWWGASKKEYYDGEVIETEDNALEEEEEARRLQKKQLSRMAAEDFFDADDWNTDGAATGEADKTGAAAAGAVVTVTMKTAEEIDGMSAEERYELLKTLYPEFDYVCDEFAELEPLLNEYKKAAEGKAGNTLEAIQYRVLGCYVSTMALYFSLLMAPARDKPTGSQFLMDPEELHSHEVMEYLMDSRQTWERVKHVQARRQETGGAGRESKAEEKTVMADELPQEKARSEEPAEKRQKKERKDKAKKETKEKKRTAAVSKEVEKSIADLSTLLAKNKKKRATLAATTTPTTTSSSKKEEEDSDDDADADFGEEESMDARTAAEKLKRKKSLGFYTSQIMQKANRRADAGGQAGGDLDIPYRERLRDRQARLNAAAVRRGQDEAGPGEELGADEAEDEQDRDDSRAAKDADLAYYNSFVQAHRQKMDGKAARQAEVQAGRLDRVDAAMGADEDGRRQISWEIEKNKGLSHKTLKEKKNNPRVKKRIKFEKKTKQMASKRAVYKGGNDRNNYQGELTGIKTGLVRSIKLS
ncbi:sas10 utp3 family protein [Grosmannia clavigera kw1407]|uniref:Sas10 utp3 family protein n=1 Tax=Grosmannia clavigera (strain kw1407 / UAMH 11150) TaxID=655863 RepID=F0XUH3_GROCL|nr:sas10 utp3 family protein [Grosmannia clavigera kw1407]EFW98962.1 sas10 utp3 family protein [Grosmannia clavigera kw1407]